STLACAAAFFSRPSARTIGRVQRKRSTPIAKLSSERCVCAPQYRSAGTWTVPIESRSSRVFIRTSSPRNPRIHAPAASADAEEREGDEAEQQCLLLAGEGIVCVLEH